MGFKKHLTVRNAKKVYKFAQKHQGTAKKALRIAKKLQRLVNTEIKHVDTSSGATWLTTDNTSATVGSLFTIAQGTAQSQRSGDSVKAMSLNVKMYVNTSGSGGGFFRVLIIKGVNERSTAPSIGAIYQNTGSAAILHSPRHPQWDTIYKVIGTKTIYFPANTGDFQSRRLLNFNLRLGHHICFNPGATTTETGGIWLMTLSDTSATYAPQFQYTSRLRYVDN